MKLAVLAVLVLVAVYVTFSWVAFKLDRRRRR